MADFTQIIQEINDDINTNGVGAITGAKLNEVLRDMIAAVNAAKQDPLTIDATPTEDSTNPVQSGGVYEALNNLIANGGLFGGFVKPSTADADTKYYYLTDVGGLYPYFDNIYVNDDSLVLFYYANNSWQGAIIAPSYQLASKALLSEDLYVALGFPLFDSSLNYAQGDVVVYEGYLYVFTTDHHGQWDISDVEYNDINKELKDLYVDLVELIDAKQDVISDLATIRSGAAAGATAVQPSDLATVATSGSYNDLLNKPTIPAAQVQSDWNEADNTKVDYIKNKPTIPDVSGKADKVGGATNGDFAGLDASGNLTDSGVAAEDVVTKTQHEEAIASLQQQIDELKINKNTRK